MRRALKRAREILQRCKQSSAPINIDKIIEREGINLDDWRFAGRIKEAYLGDSIGIKNTVNPRKKRELIAHALGHHFLHTGNHLYFEEHDQFVTFKQEYEAQCFAAELLIPTSILKPMKTWPIHELAEYFCVTEELVKFRLKILKGER